MVTILNQTGIDRITISNVQETAPTPNQQPKQAKRRKRTVADHPFEKTRELGIYCDPNPHFDFFEPTKVWSSST